MWGRADLESFYITVARAAIVIILVGLLGLAYCVRANADEQITSPDTVINFPLVCSDKKTFTQRMGFTAFYPTWHGIRNKTFLSTLWLRAGGMWVLTEERVMSKTICILASGEDNELLGIGGI
jgi:hypothetical protein